MENLYKKLNVENFYAIQEELKVIYGKVGPLEKKIKHRYERHYALNITYKIFKHLSAFINDRAKCPIEFSKYYITPPKKQWGPHIDGTFDSVYKVCINIPVANYTNSKTIWNEVPYYDTITGPFGHNGGPVTLCDTTKQYKIIDETCLDKIMIMRTDVFHDVINYDNDNPRVNFIVRLGTPEPISVPKKDFHEYFDLTGLI